MAKELIIAASLHETKLAILEDEQLAEIYFERPEQQSIAGGIYKGRVTRVLPGMQSAFVDIGLERDAFLYVSDFYEDTEEYDKIVTGVEETVAKMEAEQASRVRPVHAPPAVPPAVPPAMPPPAPITAPPAVKPEPVAEAPPSPAGPPAPQPADFQRSGEHGDRRHRRPRRRRFRDRGFPESKYASRRDIQAPEEERAFTKPAEDYEPVILPGESLAKYQKPAPAFESAAERTTDEDREAREPSPAEAPDLAEAATETGSDEAPQAALPASGAVETKTEGPPEAPVPEASTEASLEDLETVQEMPHVPGVVPVHMPPHVLERSRSAATQPQQETPAVVPPAAAAEELDRGFSSMQALPKEPGDSVTPFMEAPAGSEFAVEPAASELEGEGGPEEGEDESAEAVAGAQAAEQAEVRAPVDNPRFMQRMGRRMRRRGRDRDRFAPRGEAPVPEAAPAPPTRPERKGQPLITDLLREGQEILVQIAKEPLGKKGARITSHIALPGRFVVYMPTVDHVGVSRKIGSDEERQRLKRILLDSRRSMSGGFIVRTAGEGCREEDLRADMQFLYRLWVDIRQRAEKKPAPAFLHGDLNLIERILRDQISDEFTAIWVDNEPEYEKVLAFVQKFQPTLVNKVKLYTKNVPIFEEFGIEEEIDKALKPKVWLKSGGYIVINQTEALVAIDVNTGKYIGKTARLEDTIVKTNVDAIREIVRQIRLRDLGGIIVIDFIDMDERKNRQRVMQALDEALRGDRAPSKILAFNDFGLVAITRKRVKQSLERTLCAPCPTCTGSGYLKSPHTVAMEILGEAHKLVPFQGRRDITLRVNPDVARYLKQRNVSVVQEIEEMTHQTVIIKSDASLHPESFDFN